MATDYNLGTNAVTVTSKRFIPRLDWRRDRGTKTEELTGFVEQTETDDLTGEIVKTTTYAVTITDNSINGCRGHNNFLSDLKDILNTCVQQYKAGTPVDAVTGSVVILN